MATAASWHGRISSVCLLHRRHLVPAPKRRHGLCFKQCHFFLGTVRIFTVNTPKSTLGVAEPSLDAEDACIGLNDLSLACPICYKSFVRNRSHSSIDTQLPYGSNLNCNICNKAYISTGAYLDLTVASGSDDFIESMPGGTELFRSPIVSFLYERGWRQVFPLAGFPGPEKEFEMANEYLKTTFGGTMIDASCGSGLFSRMFSKSGLFKHVVALDFSENMLKQCSDFIKQEGLSTNNITLARADISRLPFESKSIDAVHAGAALHCWPSPSSAMAEISRILRPGGVFVGTTFIADGIYGTGFPFSLGSTAFNLVTGQNLFTSEAQLEALCTATGLVSYSCVRNRFFVMISAVKPN